MSKVKLEDTDLYELLEIQITATEAEIKKAYRKKALQCHPDKNPDNPKAAEIFHELAKALEILGDSAARAAYDKVLRAKQAARLRHKELDSKRQKLKDDLERREREAVSNKSYKIFDNRTDEEKLKAEIDRLQKEGSRLLHEEQDRMKRELKKESQKLATPVWDSSLNRIKLQWKSDKNDESNGGYNDEILKRFLKKYGEINALIISPKKKGRGLVEFCTKEASEMAIEFEKGLPDNPLTVKWLNDASSLTTDSQKANPPTVVSDRDYETLVLRKIRQAAERQKLIDEMLKEEQDAANR